MLQRQLPRDDGATHIGEADTRLHELVEDTCFEGLQQDPFALP